MLLVLMITSKGIAGDWRVMLRAPASTWDETEIAQFEKRHAIGTRARLALALLLYTAQRRGDVVRMGRQHLRDGVITVRNKRQAPNQKSRPTPNCDPHLPARPTI